MEIADNVFCYPWRGQGNNCNSYALRYKVDGLTRYALVDPGHLVVPVPVSNGKTIVNMQEPGLEALLSSLRTDGIHPGEVDMVINTHGHADHCEASLWWKESFPGRMVVALHEADRDRYAKAIRGNNRRPDQARSDDQPDLFLDEGELRLGRPEQDCLQVFHTPGHSPGSICLFWPQAKVLIAGDVMFFRAVGRTDLPGGSAAQLREGIKRLSALEIEHLLCGHAYGHPGIISGRDTVEANFRFILSYVLR
ncbi:MAG: MBL fold metallo-hydrolase [Chloroflexi bacterium]|nr:MBL fold metallo-hydrolase [Chloroflexota bacterium]